MGIIAGATYREGVAYSPDGAMYVTPTGTSSITGGTIGGSPITSGGITTILGKGLGGTAAADTNVNTLATITVPANAMGANGALRVKLHFTFTSSVNNKTLLARFSGAAGTLYLNQTVTNPTSVTYDFWIANQNSTSSQTSMMGTGLNSGGTAGALSVVTSSVDTTAATTLVITGQKALAGETLTLTWYSVELLSNGA